MTPKEIIYGYPGVDVLGKWNNSYWIVKQLVSAARQFGKRHLLSELYGCTGWQLDFEGHKNIGDWQALLGIDIRCHHLSWYTMRGEAKRDFPASIFFQSPWWKEYKFVEDYFSRIAFIQSLGTPICHTLVISPVESIWCQFYPGWCNSLEPVSPEVKKLEKQYADLFMWLANCHIYFDYADEEILGRLSVLNPCQDGETQICVGFGVYTQVIVAGMTKVHADSMVFDRAR